MCWNVFQPPPEVSAAFAEVHRETLPESIPNFWAAPHIKGYDTITTKTEAGIRDSGAFSEPAQWSYEWERLYTTAEWLDQMPTSGGFNRLDPDLIERVLIKTGEAIDALGGGFTMGYTTMVLTAVRNGSTAAA